MWTGDGAPPQIYVVHQPNTVNALYYPESHIIIFYDGVFKRFNYAEIISGFIAHELTHSVKDRDVLPSNLVASIGRQRLGEVRADLEPLELLDKKGINPYGCLVSLMMIRYEQSKSRLSSIFIDPAHGRTIYRVANILDLLRFPNFANLSLSLTPLKIPKTAWQEYTKDTDLWQDYNQLDFGRMTFLIRRYWSAQSKEDNVDLFRLEANSLDRLESSLPTALIQDNNPRLVARTLLYCLLPTEIHPYAPDKNKQEYANRLATQLIKAWSKDESDFAKLVRLFSHKDLVNLGLDQSPKASRLLSQVVATWFKKGQIGDREKQKMIANALDKLHQPNLRIAIITAPLDSWQDHTPESIQTYFETYSSLIIPEAGLDIEDLLLFSDIGPLRPEERATRQKNLEEVNKIIKARQLYLASKRQTDWLSYLTLVQKWHNRFDQFTLDETAETNIEEFDYPDELTESKQRTILQDWPTRETEMFWQDNNGKDEVWNLLTNLDHNMKQRWLITDAARTLSYMIINSDFKAREDIDIKIKDAILPKSLQQVDFNLLAASVPTKSDYLVAVQDYLKRLDLQALEPEEANQIKQMIQSGPDQAKQAGFPIGWKIKPVDWNQIPLMAKLMFYAHLPQLSRQPQNILHLADLPLHSFRLGRTDVDTKQRFPFLENLDDDPSQLWLQGLDNLLNQIEAGDKSTKTLESLFVWACLADQSMIVFNLAPQIFKKLVTRLPFDRALAMLKKYQHYPFSLLQPAFKALSETGERSVAELSSLFNFVHHQIALTLESNQTMGKMALLDNFFGLSHTFESKEIQAAGRTIIRPDLNPQAFFEAIINPDADGLIDYIWPRWFYGGIIADYRDFDPSRLIQDLHRIGNRPNQLIHSIATSFNYTPFKDVFNGFSQAGDGFRLFLLRKLLLGEGSSDGLWASADGRRQSLASLFAQTGGSGNSEIETLLEAAAQETSQTDLYVMLAPYLVSRSLRLNLESVDWWQVAKRKGPEIITNMKLKIESLSSKLGRQVFIEELEQLLNSRKNKPNPKTDDSGNPPALNQKEKLRILTYQHLNKLPGNKRQKETDNLGRKLIEFIFSLKTYQLITGGQLEQPQINKAISYYIYQLSAEALDEDKIANKIGQLIDKTIQPPKLSKRLMPQSTYDRLFDLFKSETSTASPPKEYKDNWELLIDIAEHSGAVGTRLLQRLPYLVTPPPHILERIHQAQDNAPGALRAQVAQIINQAAEISPELKDIIGRMTLSEKAGGGSIVSVYPVRLADDNQTYALGVTNPNAGFWTQMLVGALERVFQRAAAISSDEKRKSLYQTLAWFGSQIGLWIEDELNDPGRYESQFHQDNNDFAINDWTIKVPQSEITGLPNIRLETWAPGQTLVNQPPTADAAMAIFINWLGQINRMGPYHSDVHPGNFKVDEENRDIYILDRRNPGFITDKEKALFISMITLAQNGQWKKITNVFIDLVADRLGQPVSPQIRQKVIAAIEAKSQTKQFKVEDFFTIVTELYHHGISTPYQLVLLIDALNRFDDWFKQAGVPLNQLMASFA